MHLGVWRACFSTFRMNICLYLPLQTRRNRKLAKFQILVYHWSATRLQIDTN